MNGKIYTTCTVLGRAIPPPPYVTEQLRDDRWSAQERDALYHCIREEKIIPQAYRNAQLLRAAHPAQVLDGIIEQFAADVERFNDFGTRIVPMVQHEVSAILDAAGVAYLFIKGASFRTYPHGYLRQMNDLDVIVESWDDLFAAVGALAAAGYQHGHADEMAWIAHVFAEGSPAERLVGHLNMTRELDGYDIDIDLHTRTYVVASVGVLDLDLWRRARATGGHTPTPEDALLILIAHAVNHGYFLLKDLNDVYALLNEHGTSFDWAYVYGCLGRSSLSYAASYLFRRLSDEYAPAMIPTWLYLRLCAQSPLVARALIGLTTRSIERWRGHGELIIQTLHTMLSETARHGVRSGFRQSIQYLWWSLRLLVLQKRLLGTLSDHPFVQQRLHQMRPLLLPFPQRGRQVLILSLAQLSEALDRPESVPSHAAVAEALRAADPALLAQHRLRALAVGRHVFFIGHRQAEVLVTPIDIFVPTEDVIFTDDEAAALGELIEALQHIQTTPSALLASA